MIDRKNLAMRKQRSFNLELKRQVVEGSLSWESYPVQLCRWCNISSSPLYHWKWRYITFQTPPIMVSCFCSLSLVYL